MSTAIIENRMKFRLKKPSCAAAASIENLKKRGHTKVKTKEEERPASHETDVREMHAVAIPRLLRELSYRSFKAAHDAIVSHIGLPQARSQHSRSSFGIDNKTTTRGKNIYEVLLRVAPPTSLEATSRI